MLDGRERANWYRTTAWGFSNIPAVERRVGARLSPRAAPTRSAAVAEQSKILGGEASLWGEEIDGELLIQRAWPRAAAFAERLCARRGGGPRAPFAELEPYLQKMASPGSLCPTLTKEAADEVARCAHMELRARLDRAHGGRRRREGLDLFITDASTRPHGGRDQEGDFPRGGEFDVLETLPIDAWELRGGRLLPDKMAEVGENLTLG